MLKKCIEIFERDYNEEKKLKKPLEVCEKIKFKLKLNEENSEVSSNNFKVGENEVFLQNNLSNYLYNLANKGVKNIYFSYDFDDYIQGIKENRFLNHQFEKEKFKGYYLRVKQNTDEAEVERFDVVSKYDDQLKGSIIIRDYLDIEKDNNWIKLNYGEEIVNLSDLVIVLNSILFKNKLFKIVFDSINELNKIEPIIKYISKIYKTIFYDLVVKGDIDRFLNVYKSIFLIFIKNSIENNGISNEVYEMFNLMLSIEDGLKNYNEKSIEDYFYKKIEHIKRKILKCPLDKESSFENDEEYYFCVGQVMRYMLEGEEWDFFTCKVVVEFLEKPNDDTLKHELLQIFRSYENKIKINEVKFTELLRLTLDYTPSTQKINQELVLGGFLSKNLI